jgi:hypothetical protein
MERRVKKPHSKGRLYSQAKKFVMSSKKEKENAT